VKNYIVFFLLVFAQSMSFTFISRARNNNNFKIAWFASLLSNGTYLLVFRKLVMKFDDLAICILYVVAMTIGTVIQMAISIRYIEKGKPRGAR